MPYTNALTPADLFAGFPVRISKLQMLSSVSVSLLTARRWKEMKCVVTEISCILQQFFIKLLCTGTAEFLENNCKLGYGALC